MTEFEIDIERMYMRGSITVQIVDGSKACKFVKDCHTALLNEITILVGSLQFSVVGMKRSETFDE